MPSGREIPVELEHYRSLASRSRPHLFAELLFQFRELVIRVFRRVLSDEQLLVLLEGKKREALNEYYLRLCFRL